MKQAIAFIVAFAVTFVMYRGASELEGAPRTVVKVLALPAAMLTAWVAVGAL